MKSFVHVLLGWLIAMITLLIALSCRRRCHEDSRIALRQDKRPYIFAALHAHQAAMVFFNDEPKLAAMVSRSDDGALLVPSLRVRNVQPIRGSTARKGKSKGGARALVELIRFVRSGGVGLITVDGPRGPRGSVQPGIVALAERSQTLIVPVAIIPSRRWVLTGTWDRMQIPKPFARLDYAFGPPIDPNDHPASEATAESIRKALKDLEDRYDPAERAWANRAAH